MILLLLLLLFMVHGGTSIILYFVFFFSYDCCLQKTRRRVSRPFNIITKSLCSIFYAAAHYGIPSDVQQWLPSWVFAGGVRAVYYAEQKKPIRGLRNFSVGRDDVSNSIIIIIIIRAGKNKNRISHSRIILY